MMIFDVQGLYSKAWPQDKGVSLKSSMIPGEYLLGAKDNEDVAVVRLDRDALVKMHDALGKELDK